MKKSILLFTTLSLLTLSFCVQALSFQEARSSGLVKELPNGFITATNSSAKAIEKKVNVKRMKHYQKIAKDTGVSIQDIGKRVAKKIQIKLKK